MARQGRLKERNGGLFEAASPRRPQLQRRPSLSAKYLLPCSCGLEVAVEPSQAGGKVQCACGKQLDVPAMREIAALEPIETGDAAETSRPAWGLRHGLLLLGAVLIVCGLAPSLYLYWNRPRPLDLDQLSVGQVWHFWEDLRQGVDRPPFPDQQYYAQSTQWLYITLSGLAVVWLGGMVCIVAALLTTKGRRPSRNTNTTSSVSSST